MEPPPRHSDPQRPDPPLLLWAYRHAMFPMVDSLTGQIDWYCPDPRGIIPLEEFHVPRNLAREVRRGRFEIRFDTAFEAVMRACAEEDRDGGTWIDERMVAAYTGLAAIGHAHSVEAWLEDRLVGGLYGVGIGAAFFGESMFCQPRAGGTNASKVCLVHLVQRLKSHRFRLLDTQFWNEHLDQFGCREIPLAEYLAMLGDAVAADVEF